MTDQPRLAPVYDLTRPGEHVRRSVEQCDARIPSRYRTAIADHPAVIEWCGQMTRYSLDAAAEPPPSLLLCGPAGVGKTWQAYGALRLLASRGHQVMWRATTAPDLYALLRPGEEGESALRRFAEARLLLLDDLGAEKHSEWVESVNYRIVNHRSAHMLPTIITTNLPVRPPADGGPSLKSVMGERVYSRLAECRRVHLGGIDRRVGR